MNEEKKVQAVANPGKVVLVEDAIYIIADKTGKLFVLKQLSDKWMIFDENLASVVGVCKTRMQAVYKFRLEWIETLTAVITLNFDDGSKFEVKRTVHKSDRDLDYYLIRKAANNLMFALEDFDNNVISADIAVDDGHSWTISR